MIDPGSAPVLHWGRLAVFVTGLFLVPPLVAQEQPERKPKERSATPAPLGTLQQIARQIKKFGPWEEQAKFIEPAMDNVWRSNGWNDEPDVFALTTAKEVARIPPWRISERLNRFTELVTDRYTLTPEQAGRLKGSIIRETAGLVMKHAPVLMEQMNKAVKQNARYVNQPPDAARVARFIAEWTRATEGLHEDALRSLARVQSEFASGLTPRQRETYDRDAGTLEKLTRFMNEKRQAWAEGRWRPEDWGMDRDMFRHAVGTAPDAGIPNPSSKKPERVASANTRMPTRWLSYDPDTWIAYARHVDARYRLDEPQRRAVRSIHDELKQRARDYLDQHEDELKDIAPAARGTHEAYKPVRDLFDALLKRLDAIPTRAQEDGATP